LARPRKTCREKESEKERGISDRMFKRRDAPNCKDKERPARKNFDRRRQSWQKKKELIKGKTGRLKKRTLCLNKHEGKLFAIPQKTTLFLNRGGRKQKKGVTRGGRAGFVDLL